MNMEQDTLAALQLVRLKGRVAAAAVADSLEFAETTSANLLQALKDAGALTESGGNFRVAPAGRETLAQWIAQERATTDHAALKACYHEFHPLNTAFKQLVSDWQLRDGSPNDHSDATYDAAIMARLVELDGRFMPLLSRIATIAPRLSRYPARFGKALQRLRAGEHAWLARPITDSYHTVWFELHEDVIGLLGLSREAEAAAGRAE